MLHARMTMFGASPWQRGSSLCRGVSFTQKDVFVLSWRENCMVQEGAYGCGLTTNACGNMIQLIRMIDQLIRLILLADRPRLGKRM